jgi:chromate reductase
MTQIVAIPGSWRSGSYNAALAQAAAGAAPAGCTVHVASLRDIPLYDGDVEKAGIPAAVSALKDRVAAADGLLLVSPEYNNSVPGVMKNAIDWLSRPPKDSARVFGNRAVGLIGATPGAGGTRLAQAAWLPVLRTLGTRPWFGKSLYVSDAAKVFDEQGGIADAKVRELLAAYMKGFAEFCAAR